MQTIEERAKSYARKVWRGGVRDFVGHKKATELDFIAGADWMRKEMTRWCDPKEELPEEGQRVLLKGYDGRCTNVFLGSFSCGVWTTDDDFVFHTDADSVIGFDGVVTGWRPIHE